MDPRSPRKLRCALLTFWPYWPGEALIACPGLEMVAFDSQAIAFPEDRNPFDLPRADRADVALVSAWWYLYMTTHFPDRAELILREIERRSDSVIGLDGPDRFSLTFTPEAMRRFQIVIKAQGLYRDRELYNYAVGPMYEGALWTEKVRPARERYAPADLEKLRLSVPSFVTEFPAVRDKNRAHRRAQLSELPKSRRRATDVELRLLDRFFTSAVGIATQRGRRQDVHCLTGLSHVQRIEAVQLLAGLSGTQGIAPTQGSKAELVFGTTYGGQQLPAEVAAGLVEDARPFFRPSLSRLRFVLDLRRHKVVVAPTGYGEIGNRHGLALLAGTALVCQDLSHVETMLPLIDRQNVAFCRPDLRDLRTVVEELLADDAQRERIARQGRTDFVRWAGNAERLLRDGLESHIREAAGTV